MVDVHCVGARVVDEAWSCAFAAVHRMQSDDVDAEARQMPGDAGGVVLGGEASVEGEVCSPCAEAFVVEDEVAVAHGDEAVFARGFAVEVGEIDDGRRRGVVRRGHYAKGKHVHVFGHADGI